MTITTGGAKLIQLTKGYAATVDAEDFEYLMRMGSWCIKLHGRTAYARKGLRLPDGRVKTLMMHKVLTGYAMTDHINGDGLDNRRCNLRQIDKLGNAQNSRAQLNNTSGATGVYRIDGKNPWRASIRINRVLMQLGSFPTLEEASAARDIAALRYHGKYARLNSNKAQLNPNQGQRGDGNNRAATGSGWGGSGDEPPFLVMP